jgi:hypothetical protein
MFTKNLKLMILVLGVATFIGCLSRPPSVQLPPSQAPQVIVINPGSSSGSATDSDGWQNY